MTLTLTWPPKELNPNARVHWRPKARIKQKYKSDCYFLAKANRPKLPEGDIPLLLTFHPPTARHHDADNCMASFKAGQDGIAEAWRINDRRFRPITVFISDPVKHGRVLVDIKRMNEVPL